MMEVPLCSVVSTETIWGEIFIYEGGVNCF